MSFQLHTSFIINNVTQHRNIHTCPCWLDRFSYFPPNSKVCSYLPSRTSKVWSYLPSPRGEVWSYLWGQVWNLKEEAWTKIFYIRQGFKDFLFFLNLFSNARFFNKKKPPSQPKHSYCNCEPELSTAQPQLVFLNVLTVIQNERSAWGKAPTLVPIWISIYARSYCSASQWVVDTAPLLLALHPARMWVMAVATQLQSLSLSLHTATELYEYSTQHRCSSRPFSFLWNKGSRQN